MKRMVTPTSVGRPLFGNLEALRGIFALLVALFHVPWINVCFYASPVLHAWAAVDFFFVLSGFVIAYNYVDVIHDFKTTQEFMVRRLFRLVPLHVVTLLACLSLDLLRDAVLPLLSSRFQLRPSVLSLDYWSDVGWSLLLLQGMGVTTVSRPNPPSWSISDELFAYVIFALVCLLARRKLRAWIIGMIAIAAFIALQKLQGWSGINGPLEFRFFRCLYAFGLGVLVAEVFLRTNLRVPQRWNAFLQILLWGFVIGLLYIIEREDFRSSILPVAFAAIILLSAWDAGSRIRRVLECPACRRVGELSYSIYMVHVFVGSILGFIVNRFAGTTGAVFDIVRPQLPAGLGEVFLLVYLGLVIALSSWTYEYVEKPWREVGRRHTRAIRPGVMYARS